MSFPLGGAEDYPQNLDHAVDGCWVKTSDRRCGNAEAIASLPGDLINRKRAEERQEMRAKRCLVAVQRTDTQQSTLRECALFAHPGRGERSERRPGGWLRDVDVSKREWLRACAGHGSTSDREWCSSM